MIKMLTQTSVKMSQIEKLFNDFVESYPTGYKGHTITEHDGLYDITIVYDDGQTEG